MDSQQLLPVPKKVKKKRNEKNTPDQLKGEESETMVLRQSGEMLGANREARQSDGEPMSPKRSNGAEARRSDGETMAPRRSNGAEARRSDGETMVPKPSTGPGANLLVTDPLGRRGDGETMVPKRSTGPGTNVLVTDPLGTIRAGHHAAASQDLSPYASTAASANARGALLLAASPKQEASPLRRSFQKTETVESAAKRKAGRPQKPRPRPASLDGGMLSDANMEGTDMAGTLEYLRRWTHHQDHISHQLVEHQKLMESMIQRLVQTNASGVVSSQSPARIGVVSSPPKAYPAFDVTTMTGVESAQSCEDQYGFTSSADSDDAVVDQLALDKRESQSEEAGMACRNTINVRKPGGSRASLGKVHSVFVNAIFSHVPAERHKTNNSKVLKFFEEIVESPKFEFCAACFIFLHSVFIGASVEYVASESSEKHKFFVAGNVIFVCIFCFEVAVKMVAERHEFYLGSEWRWNAFDIFLILTVLIETMAGIVLSGKNDEKKSMKTLLKLAEMVRTLRVIRIFRMLKFSITLSVIVSKIMSSARSLLWIGILLVLLLYVMSVCLTQGYNDFLDGKQHIVGHNNLLDTEKQMHRYFGSVPKSFFTLFASIAGGIAWADVSEVLLEVSLFYAAMFFMFQALSIIAVMNLITGIFVNDAIRSDVDIVMEADGKRHEQQKKHLLKIFGSMDHNKSGTISLQEFTRFAKEPSLEVYLKALNITASEAETLFHLLDEDQSGCIQIEEFLSGCLQLRGEATSIDMKTLIYDEKRARHRIFRHIDEMDVFVGQTKTTLSMLTSSQQRWGTMPKKSSTLSMPPPATTVNS